MASVVWSATAGKELGMGCHANRFSSSGICFLLFGGGSASEFPAVILHRGHAGPPGLAKPEGLGGGDGEEAPRRRSSVREVRKLRVLDRKLSQVRKLQADKVLLCKMPEGTLASAPGCVPSCHKTRRRPKGQKEQVGCCTVCTIIS